MQGEQRALFEVPAATLPAAETSESLQRLGAALRARASELRFGTMSWAYPGWRGVVYGERAPLSKLSELGLSAYAQHPLLRAAEIDRSYYEPLDAATFARFAAQTPADFRFVAKAHSACTLGRFPEHARFGRAAGQPNPLQFDVEHAVRAVVEPFVEGLGARAFALLFQFSPEPYDPQPRRFIEKMHAFVRKLPRLPDGVVYAVELRNPERLGADYGAALADVGAVHTHNVWPAMPSVLAQLRRLPPSTRRPLLVRWMMPPGDEFGVAEQRAKPFDRLVREDPARRQELARLIGAGLAQGVPQIILVDNKAEGCAPRSIAKLAAALESLQ